MTAISNALALAALAIALSDFAFDVIKLEPKIANEVSERQEANSILDQRLVQVEAHYTGHRVILSKNGVAIRVEPCKLHTAHCVPDDKGIYITNGTISGWYTGVQAGVMEAPAKQ